MFGFFTYDLKNELEALTSRNPDYLNFPKLFFYIPKHLLKFNNDKIEILSVNDPQTIFEDIQQTSIINKNQHKILTHSKFHPRVEKATYLENVKAIQNHILEGDVYELNYCTEFFGNDIEIDPLETYIKLNGTSPMPFSAFQKLDDKFLLCASPERFLKKTDQNLISQPIKGTIRRGQNELEDEKLKQELSSSEKERAENMMIVDLVRNDLAKSAITGTVKVQEIFGIYSFPRVHQMISTIQAKLKEDATCVEAIKNAFPMGSMTGAPKIEAMKLIDKYENSRRGLFSGAIGYFDPKQNFDFNVIIRSIFYNQTKKYLSYKVGSAITYDAIAENEFEECKLKAAVITQILTGA
ncbi:anthranilate synthase component I family protein [Flexithrix dorotheae]|uniref:anthranilate synthase component I family protein n=1 Tax=Flexithrix dorotheae TaxID=70993 RepID=UPI0003685066|nr:anthranilate synthase component I family protein [Flexithrix dorotheae]